MFAPNRRLHACIVPVFVAVLGLEVASRPIARSPRQPFTAVQHSGGAHRTKIDVSVCQQRA
jgi:hypothetical protein